MSSKGKKLNRKCKEFFIKTRKLVGINFKIFVSLYNYTGWQLGPLEIIAFCRRQVVKFSYICSVDVKGQRLLDLSKKSSKNILNIAFQNTREWEGPTVQRTKQGNIIWTTITMITE